MILPSFHVHASVFAVIGGLIWAYLGAAKRHELATGERLEPGRRNRFLGGVAALFLGASWPLHDLAESYLYSMHMVQHMLFTFVAAPLLLTGMPAWMWRACSVRHRRAAWGLLTRPLVALVVANGVLFFIHWPEIVRSPSAPSSRTSRCTCCSWLGDRDVVAGVVAAARVARSVAARVK